MKQVPLAAVVFALALSASALAGTIRPDDLRLSPPWGSTCGLSVHRDSYGKGVEAGFRGIQIRPRLVDEQCYLLGLQQGRLVASSQEIKFSCTEDFEQGRAQGLAAEIESGSLSDCQNAGFAAGEAALDVGAREGDTALVGTECVEQYQAGSQDAGSSHYADRPFDSKLATCYITGFNDATLFR